MGDSFTLPVDVSSFSSHLALPITDSHTHQLH